MYDLDFVLTYYLIHSFANCIPKCQQTIRDFTGVDDYILFYRHNVPLR